MTGPNIIPPNTWIDTSAGDGPETFIPIASGTHSLELLKAHADLFDRQVAQGQSEQCAKAVADRELDRRITMANNKVRHACLVARHADHSILSALLSEHAPHEYGHADIYLECHGCPQDWNDSDPSYQGWPCPTWTTIAEQTEGVS